MSSECVLKSQLGFYDIIWKLYSRLTVYLLVTLIYKQYLTMLTRSCHLFDVPSLIIEPSTVIFVISYDVEFCHCVWWTLFISGVICNCNNIWTLNYVWYLVVHPVNWTTRITLVCFSIHCLLTYVLLILYLDYFYFTILYVLPYFMYDC